MPNSISAKKSLRKSLTRQARNKQYKNRIKKLTRQISDLVKEDKTEEAKKLLPSFSRAVDRAAKNNILHKNTAARKKSLIARTVNPKPLETKEKRKEKTTEEKS